VRRLAGGRLRVYRARNRDRGALAERALLSPGGAADHGYRRGGRVTVQRVVEQRQTLCMAQPVLSQVCSGWSSGCGVSPRMALPTAPAARADNLAATPTPGAAPARAESWAAQGMWPQLSLLAQ